MTIANETAKAVGIKSVPCLLVSNEDVGILTIGVRKPVILMAQEALSRCSHEELQLVLAHEFAHIRRGDAWLGLLPQLTQILFCFHPLAWLACRELDLAREAACDETTLRSMQVRSDLYGRLLLKLGVRQHVSWPTLWSPGVSSHFRILHRRISMLAQVSNGSPRRQKGPVVLFACLTGVALTIPWSIVHAQNPSEAPAKPIAPKVADTPVPTPKIKDTELFESATKPTEAKLAVKHYPATLVPTVKASSATPAKTTAKLANGKTPAKKAVVAKTASITTFAGGGGGAEESERITKIIHLRNAEAAAMAQILSSLYGNSSKDSIKTISEPRTNSIILSGTTDQLMLAIRTLDELDQDAPERNVASQRTLRVITLKYARAIDVAVTLTKLFEDPTGASPRIVHDGPNNLLILANPAQYQQILGVVKVMDTPSER